VQDAWQSPDDVPEIHAAAFRACLAGIDSATNAVPDSLLIYGSAGSGKTHLLSRLQRHLAETARAAPDSVLRCVFVFVRLQTAPQMLWQHLQRRLASDLMRRDQGITQLQRLIAHQLGVRSGKTPRAAVFRLQVQRGVDPPALSQHLSELSVSLSLPRDLSLILEHLVLGRSVLDASAWLAGESLPEVALERLGLGPDVTDDREEAARSIVTALCRLAAETLPIVFCFDQVEALQRSSDDKEAFFRFGQAAADLHDTDPNVFLVTCLQSAVLETFRAAIRQADFERLAKRHFVLEPLVESEVTKLVRSRLDSLPQLATLRARRPREPHFPFSQSFLDSLAKETPCVPRRVLSAAARRFEELQHGSALVPLSPDEFLATELFLRQESAKPELSPSDTTRVVFSGVQLLTALDGDSVQSRDAGKADLVIAGKVALSLRNEVDGRSLGPKLKALLDHTPRADGARVVIVRDPRLTIAKTAVQTRRHLAELQRRGVRVIEPTLAALSALEALGSLLADAKSGDLANDGEAVHEGGVLDWLRRMRADVALEPAFELMDRIRETEPGALPAPEEQDLRELLARVRVVELEAASQTLGHPAPTLLGAARRNTEQFLVLEGPPVVLLDVAGTSAEMGQ
jgi:hypothetical protein